MPQARTTICPARRPSFTLDVRDFRKRIASRVGQLLNELLLEPLVCPSIHPRLTPSPHNNLHHSDCVAYTPPSCLRNRALTTRTTSQKYATRTSSHHRPTLLNSSTFPALDSRAGSTQARAMRRGWQESSLSTSRQMQSWECPLIWWASLAYSMGTREVNDQVSIFHSDSSLT